MDVWSVTTQLLGVLVTMAAVAVSVIMMYLHYKHRQYAHIPGPPRRSFFWGNAYDIIDRFDKGQLVVELYMEWVLKYGHTMHFFLVHQPVVITCDPQSIKLLLVTGSLPKPKMSYNMIFHLFGQRFVGRGLITETDHDHWSKRRSAINSGFSKSFLKSIMSEFNDAADTLINRLVEMADGKTSVPMLSLFHRTTLDVIAKVVFGQDLDVINSDNAPFTKAIFKGLDGFSYKIKNPINARRSDCDRSFKQEVREACKFLRDTVTSWFNERKRSMEQGIGVPDDVLTMMIRAQDEMNIPLEEVMDDFITIFIAGQETTGNMLSFALNVVGREPEILKKLQDEVDTVLGGKHNVTYDDVGRLDYMSMVLKETLRLYPPAPFTFRTNPKNININKYKVPKDTIFLLSTYASSRHPDFQKRPNEFIPERYKPESELRPPNFSVFPFSLGQRGCVGQTFALLEGKLLFAKFLQRFDFELDQSHKFGVLETATLRPDGDLPCTLSLREWTD